MSLHLILGNSGSGKTHTLYETMIREAHAFPDRNFLVIVPEQFTLETQRELTAMHPGRSLCNIDILSFQRLGYRLLEEAGTDSTRVLDDTGKNFILHRIAHRRRGELKILGANLDRMGMIDEIKSFLSELMQYNLMPEDLDRMIGEAQHTSLKWKLEDIRLLYADFLEEIDGKAMTAEGLLSQMGRLAADSAILRDSVIALDGYTGFTPVQNELIAALLQCARDVYVTVTIDVREDAEGLIRPGSMSDLFYLSRRTIRSLTRIAREHDVETAEPLFCTGGREYRFREAPQLYHLEQHLFRNHAPADAVCRRGPQEGAQVEVYACTEPRDELAFCLQRIRRQVMETGCSYGDFAIMTGDLSRYENFAEELFEVYEVPYFPDRTRRLDYHPFPQAIRSLLQILTDDFSVRSVFAFLRSGFGPLGDEETDLLENHVLAAGIRGHSAWSRIWRRNPLKLSEAQMETLNALRQQLLDALAPLRETFADRQADISEKTMALYRFLTAQGAEEILAERAEMFRAKGDPVRAREEEQIWTLTMQLLEKLVTVLGDTKVSAKEYRELFEAGCSATTLRVAPPQKETVVFGDMERTRLNHVKTLFLIGANDGVIPGAGPEGGLLSEFERQSLKDAGEELAYTARETVLLQNFYLYQNLTKPTRSLQITYAARGADGSALRRSSLIAAVGKLYEDLPETVPEEDALLTRSSALEAFARQTGTIAETWEHSDGLSPAASEEWKALSCLYQDDMTQVLLQAACGGTTDSRLQKQTARSLYGRMLQGSVSRLEKYADCAFSHFAAYGLRLQERVIASFEPADMGNLLHDAIRNYTVCVREAGYTFHGLTNAQIDHYAQLAMDMAMAEREGDAAFESAANRQIAERLRRVFYRTAHVVTEQVQAGAFEPAATEVPFRELRALDDGGMMQLNGRIDRVDTARIGRADADGQDREAVRIVDYKSSKKEFRPEELYEGRSLQLPLYLAAVAEERGRTDERDVLAAGMFYYAMIDPVLEEVPGETDEEYRRRLKKELRLSGPINDDPQAVRAMDDLAPGAESEAVNLGRKGDGALYARCDVLPQADFELLPAFAKKKALQIANEIADGQIQADPHRNGQRSSCDYCPYGSVCGFDAKQPQFRYRTTLKKDEALSKIKEEMA